MVAPYSRTVGGGKSSWSAKRLHLNLGRTELLLFLANQSIHHHVDSNIGTLSLAPTKAVQNL